MSVHYPARQLLEKVDRFARREDRSGERRIFDFARVWRNRERGALHAPEFTMLEWYRAGEPYAVLMEDCGALLRLAAETAGDTKTAEASLLRAAAMDRTYLPRWTLANFYLRAGDMPPPTRKPISIGLPLSSSFPGPTAITLPLVGFSLVARQKPRLA